MRHESTWFDSPQNVMVIKKGVALEDGDALLESLENEVMKFEPTKEREKIVHAEVLQSLDTMLEQRRLRLQAVTTGLPAALCYAGSDGASPSPYARIRSGSRDERPHASPPLFFPAWRAFVRAISTRGPWHG